MPRRIWVLALAVCLATLEETPAGSPAEPKRGEFGITFTERSPLSPVEEMAKRFGWKIDPAKPARNYDLSQESFQAYVPASYQPATPFGLFVFINSVDSGGIPGGWKAVFDRHNLIWIGANKSGNERGISARFGLALDGAHNMKKLYAIDEDRVYLSGSSGGSHCAADVAPIYADLFQGAFYIIAAHYNYHDKPKMPNLSLAKSRSRFVMLTGENDTNRKMIQATFDIYKKDKFANVLYLEVPGMGHANPDAEWFEKGIVALDEPLAAAARKFFDEAAVLEKNGRLGLALQAYGKAALRGRAQAFGKDAQARAAALSRQRDEQIAAAKLAIGSKKYAEAQAILQKTIKQFEEAPGEAKELLERSRSDPAIAAEMKTAQQNAEAQKKEMQASADLEAGRQLLARNLAGGYQALRETTRKHPGTQAAATAAAEADKIWADADKRKQIESQQSAQEAQGLLKAAQLYVRNGMKDEARERLEKIAKLHPGTPAAAEAQKLLKEIGK